jgi:hypothetical protein
MELGILAAMLQQNKFRDLKNQYTKWFIICI